MTIGLTCRPLSDDAAVPRRGQVRSPFRAGWSQTVDLLSHELWMLKAQHAVIEIAVGENEIRNDGWPRATARPQHAGVVVSFESKYGPLRYPCTKFDYWQDNVRAVAIALEALRKVDRYGVTKRGEQYTGWKQLQAGKGDGDPTRGRQIIAEYGSRAAALKATHPDTGGDGGDFRDVLAAGSRND